MTQPADQPREAIQINSDDVPQAAALASICRGLHAARRGLPSANPSVLINEGARLIGEFQTRDRNEWAALSAMAAEFWGIAATFQPRFAQHEVAARKALSAARVTVRTGGRRR